MLQGMGWKEGEGLGRSKQGETEPVLIQVRRLKRWEVSAWKFKVSLVFFVLRSQVISWSVFDSYQAILLHSGSLCFRWGMSVQGWAMKILTAPTKKAIAGGKLALGTATSDERPTTLPASCVALKVFFCWMSERRKLCNLLPIQLPIERTVNSDNRCYNL